MKCLATDCVRGYGLCGKETRGVFHPLCEECYQRIIREMLIETVASYEERLDNGDCEVL